MVFREELALESQDSITFGKDSGCFLSRCCAGVLLLLFLLALLITGLLVYHLSPSACTGSGGAGVPEDRTKGTPDRVSGVRLPSHLLPESYNVRLLPFIEEGNFTFDGHVTMSLRATGSGNNITVHFKDMLIREDSVEVKDSTAGNSIGTAGYKYDADREFFIILLQQDTQEGHVYDVSISFTGNLNDKLAGFYRSSYEDVNGNTKWIAVTQFQPTDARRAFPCFDEPALKAIFNITMGRKQQMRSVSNMPLSRSESVTDMPGYTWDIFQPTVPMSTYLVAFMVSDFDMKEAEPGASDTLFRVWSRPQALEQAEYAREIGPAILNYFEEFFKTKFPLPKQDMVALTDFAAGAMENWGLITYRETALLYKPGVSSAVNKQRVAVVVSHELAHQWFGNLVTPSWWTDLWLNEGFASYVEYLGVDKVEPEWKMMEQFITEDLQSVMSTDALETSHPISIVVHHPDEINEIFDSISYKKGASIIRMMNHYLTTETMQNGLASYLKDNQYKAATQDDLWRSLTTQAHEDNTLPTEVTVKDIMDTWTLQMGYPVLKLERNYQTNTAMVTQARYLLNGPRSTDTLLWWIPITFTSQGAPDFNKTNTKQWMPKTKQMEIKDLPPAEEWVIFNIQETGYYKVNYDQKNWDMILKQLMKDHTIIHSINRAQLIDDSLDLARSGQLGYETALATLGYLEKETEYLPWDAAFNNIGYINTQLKRTPGYGAFKRFLIKLIASQYQTVGFEERSEDGHLDHYRRTNLLKWACGMGQEDCTQRSQQLFMQWMQQPLNDSIIAANKRSIVYCTAIREGTAEEWDFAWQRSKTTNVAAEKRRLLSALGCTKQIWLLSRYLSWLLTTDSEIRVQDGSLVFAAISRNPVGRYLAWNFLRNSWPDLVRTYGGGVFVLPRFIAALKSGGYNTALDLQELKLFESDNRADLSDAAREMKQVIESTTNNVAWMNRNYESVINWLQKYSP